MSDDQDVLVHWFRTCSGRRKAKRRFTPIRTMHADGALAWPRERTWAGFGPAGVFVDPLLPTCICVAFSLRKTTGGDALVAQRVPRGERNETKSTIVAQRSFLLPLGPALSPRLGAKRTQGAAHLRCGVPRGARPTQKTPFGRARSACHNGPCAASREASRGS